MSLKILGAMLVSLSLVVITMLAVMIGKVPAGYVGVRVHLLGASKGVDAEELPVGWYFITLNEQLFKFPTFTQNYVWTQDATEGSPTDESLMFQTKQGLDVSTDLGISYHIDPSKVTLIFQKYRKGIDEITNIFLRNMVRDALVNAGSTREVEDIYGPGKRALLADVEKEVSDQVAPIGIVIEKLYWVGKLRLPGPVVTAINAKIEAVQKAATRQNEIAQERAEADKAIERSRGAAQSRLNLAEAEAKAIEVKGQALRDNPGVLQLNSIEKWDGKLPMYMGASGPLPFLNVVK